MTYKDTQIAYLKANGIIILLLSAAIAAVAYVRPKVLEQKLPDLMEIPKSAVSGTVVEHIGYTVSFNNKWLIPNWVAYELTKEEAAGTVKRSNSFLPDPKIIGCPTTDDYKGSGYDRGHMAPAGDMKWSEQAMNESCYLSNICPQNQNLNGGDWKDLEEVVRSMAGRYGSIYVVCGPIVSQNYKTIGSGFNKIAVPDAFFKALLVQSGDQWKAIGFMFENKAGHKKLSSYAMSIDDLELITDMDFFSSLPDDVEELVEESYNLNDWNIR